MPDIVLSDKMPGEEKIPSMIIIKQVYPKIKLLNIHFEFGYEEAPSMVLEVRNCVGKLVKQLPLVKHININDNPRNKMINLNSTIALNNPPLTISISSQKPVKLRLNYTHTN
jgi:hypothetical protein